MQVVKKDLEFIKFFDKLKSHSHLLHKLSHYGIHENTLNWISDFLTDRTQHVLLDNKKSTICKVLSGVPPGLSTQTPAIPIIY